MKDLDLEAINGNLNVEFRTDGGIGIYYECGNEPTNTLMLNREQMLKLAAWLVAYIDEGRK